MAMIVRNPKPSEVDAAAEVAAAAFDGLSIEHWMKSFHEVAEDFGERYILVAELDGKIVSSLMCMPEPVIIGDAEVSHASVGSVGTLPEYRRQGCAAAMMTECVKLLREEGICLSSLWPFSYPYYRKFGWEVGAEARVYSARTAFFETLGDPSSVRTATPSDRKAIVRLYDEWYRGLNCMTSRGKLWWKRLFGWCEFLDFRIVVRTICGEIDAYACYELDRRGDDSVVKVLEIAFQQPSSRRDLIAFIASQHPDMDMEFRGPRDDLFVHEIADPRAITTKLQPSFQFRVIDPEIALKALRPSCSAFGGIRFSISDPVFEHGFEIELSETDFGGLGRREPYPSESVSMTVQTLAKLITGYLNVSEAADLGLVRLEDDLMSYKAMLSLFSCQEPFRSGLEPG